MKNFIVHFLAAWITFQLVMIGIMLPIASNDIEAGNYTCETVEPEQGFSRYVVVMYPIALFIPIDNLKFMDVCDEDEHFQWDLNKNK